MSPRLPIWADPWVQDIGMDSKQYPFLKLCLFARLGLLYAKIVADAIRCLHQYYSTHLLVLAI